MTPDYAPCEAIAIGGSAGAVEIVVGLLAELPASFSLPVLICVHLHAGDRGQLADHLGTRSRVPVTEARDKTPIAAGRVHVAPADYHLLVERARTIALSIDAKVHYCRPAIDVLFESAARAYGRGLCAILLSGANEDGVAGLGSVRAHGGLTVAQDPRTASFPRMPELAVAAGVSARVLAPDGILDLVVRLDRAAAAPGRARGG